ncbi:sulfatase-like hydrolase/transferase [Marinomonas sp. GJ51-6]|uniref:sulfatase-like hydrolase/transferase n=1 Tax=Marinomonas sp. GJ51-6 TaxID=2992802 RepID=UPI002934DB37|nr:sulfatase-like hydrolase/transferase [Marinomonas sp. GJ51-6]WOD09156.1 sulfatase-like hydrolase/transferase [Marinomonas sp. GJ51-6]
MKKNILFIMCDQLRFDYLGCTGHPHIRTPNIDALAARGMLFENAFCNAALCEPSRASYYTGRYMSSHGVMANDDPLRPDEMTLGDYIRDLGSEAYVVGKSEGRINPESLTRLGIPLDSDVVLNRKDNGFTPWEHFGGLYPDPLYREGIGYNDYLKDKGYTAHNPWESVSNTSTSATGEKSSGWLLRNADKASDIKAEHSETVFLTDRAIQFIESRDGSKPWCLHLSYFKPHWPLIAPTPYNTAYSADDVLPANKHESELQDDHPAYKLFRDFEYSKTYSDDEKRAHIIPTYMGLIEELDDQIGRLLTYLDENNLTENTLIALTSDHGDYLGDHWLGEKDLFHEPSIRVPLIISES